MIFLKQASEKIPAALEWQSPHDRALPKPKGRTLIMGVLNMTPNSFSDDGLLKSKEPVLNKVDTMVRAGMDVLDIGGVPTRPPYSEKIEREKGGEDSTPVHHSYAYDVSEEEELVRILPAIKEIRQKYPKLPISVDTTRARVARTCIRAGADIINDQKALLEGIDDQHLKNETLAQARSPMAEAIKELGCPIILMHNREEASYQDFWKEMLDDLKLSLAIAENAGIPKRQLWVDPGFCFGKEVRHNLEMLKNIDCLHDLGHPILLGASRKSTLGKATGAPINQRIAATVTTTLWAQSKGVQMVRVHDVFENHQALQTFHAIAQGIDYNG